MANGDGRCQIIMRDGVLLPGMTMPVLGPPPPDPHPNPVVQRMRETWNLGIIAWDGVFSYARPMTAARRVLPGFWRSIPALLDEREDDDDGQPLRL